MNYFHSEMSKEYKYGSILWLEDGNLDLPLRTMSHTIYAAQFEQTCTFTTGKSVVCANEIIPNR